MFQNYLGCYLRAQLGFVSLSMGSDGTILDIKTGKVCIFNKRDLLVTPVLRNADRPYIIVIANQLK